MNPAPSAPLVTVDDYEATARARLSSMAYDYFRSGADEEHTLRRNREAFARYEIWYRTLVDVAEPRIATTVLGSPVAFPILIDHVSHDHRRARSGLIYPLRRGDRPLADVIPLRVPGAAISGNDTVAA